MKHRALFLTAFAVAGISLLTACTSSEEEIAQGVRTESSGNVGAGDAENVDGSAAQQDIPQDAGADTGMQDASGVQTQTDVVREENPPQTETVAPEETPTEAGTPEQIQTEMSSDNTGEAVTEDIWSGTYVGDQESVTIWLVDAGSFSFSFANSGIASTAEVDGSTAVYRGDDHHVVVFEMSEGVLHVTVSSEEDYDASASPLNGTYVRQTVTADAEWGEGET